jgi:hypothetical protein
MQINGTSIEHVWIVDDEKDVRDRYAEAITDSRLTPILVEGPLPSINQLVHQITEQGDAAIFDHHLRVHNYATFNGSESVAQLYKAGFPSVLCTVWSRASVDDIRRYRQFIPVIIAPPIDPDVFLAGIKQCIEEFKGNFSTIRRPWRTLVRVEEIDEDNRSIYIVLPAWSFEVVRLPLNYVPDEILQTHKSGETRFYAKANIGADTMDDLYLFDWETK